MVRRASGYSEGQGGGVPAAQVLVVKACKSLAEVPHLGHHGPGQVCERWIWIGASENQVRERIVRVSGSFLGIGCVVSNNCSVERYAIGHKAEW